MNREKDGSLACAMNGRGMGWHRKDGSIPAAFFALSISTNVSRNFLVASSIRLRQWVRRVTVERILLDQTFSAVVLNEIHAATSGKIIIWRYRVGGHVVVLQPCDVGVFQLCQVIPKKDFPHDPFVRFLCDVQHLHNECPATRCDAQCAAERTLKNHQN